MIEQYIESLIAEGKLDREELNAFIAEERAKNPVPAIQAEQVRMGEEAGYLRDDASYLLYDSMVKESRISDLEMTNAELTYMIMTGGM